MRKPTDYAAAAQRGKVSLLCVPIFRAYARNGYAVYRELVANCIRRLIGDPLVKAEHPVHAQVTVTEQRGRRIMHILQYSARARSPDLDIVEDGSRSQM
jgi:hypothetical protein